MCPSKPLVSVVVPAYNAARYLGATLAAARAQTYRDLEVIVVDDGSEDDTAAVAAVHAAADPRIRVYQQPNSGVAAARNFGIEQASGSLIAPLDADDLWHPQKLERQVQRMEQGGNRTGLVYTWWVSIDASGKPLWAALPWQVEGDVFEALVSLNFIGNASVPLFRRACLEAVGGYDPTFRERGAQGCEDWSLNLRIAERYAVGLVPAYLVGYRTSPGCMSLNVAAMYRSYRLVQDWAAGRPRASRRSLRWAESQFAEYLAGRCLLGTRPRQEKRWRRVLQWLVRAFLASPSAVVTPWRMAMALRALPAPLARLAARLPWPSASGTPPEELLGPSQAWLSAVAAWRARLALGEHTDPAQAPAPGVAAGGPLEGAVGA